MSKTCLFQGYANGRRGSRKKTSSPRDRRPPGHRGRRTGQGIKFGFCVHLRLSHHRATKEITDEAGTESEQQWHGRTMFPLQTYHLAQTILASALAASSTEEKSQEDPVCDSPGTQIENYSWVWIVIGTGRPEGFVGACSPSNEASRSNIKDGWSSLFRPSRLGPVETREAGHRQKRRRTEWCPTRETLVGPAPYFLLSAQHPSTCSDFCSFRRPGAVRASRISAARLDCTRTPSSHDSWKPGLGPSLRSCIRDGGVAGEARTTAPRPRPVSGCLHCRAGSDFGWEYGVRKETSVGSYLGRLSAAGRRFAHGHPFCLPPLSEYRHDLDDGPMGAKARRSRSGKPNGRASETTPDVDVDANAYANQTRSSGLRIVTSSGQATAMNTSVEYRRKGGPQESDVVTASLMARESFSLDEQVVATPRLNNHGFGQLPRQDQQNFGLLVLLYFLQGIPLGLATGSVPFLLKQHMSYGEIGVFTLASYPYSLKLLWSPVVDALWSPRLGRRKSWILPIQLLSGVGMLWLGSRVEDLMATTGKPGGPTVWTFTGWWFFLVLMCATQDIAVDGWALTLLSPGNISYALGGYLTFWGWAFIVVTVALALLKREDRSHNEEGVWDVYRIMWGVLKLRNVQAIILVHLIAKIGFQANDGVTNLKLLEKGFGTDNLALTVLIDFPFEIGLGYYVGKWSQAYTPMRLWCWGFIGRLAAAVFAQLTVVLYPAGGVNTSYLLIVIVEHVMSTFMNTMMFVAVSAFHARIADPVIGGTYMTLLATVCNLGGTFPRIFVLRLVDAFTEATCIPTSSNPGVTLNGPIVTEPFSCSVQAEKERCLAGFGTCEMQRDGYYIVNIICVLVGTITFVTFIRPQVLRLQALPLKAWRLVSTRS
ncbi:hypothetical protein CMQ_5757 [Grosmannia clavigera kw1407]|uniref:Uncharacterized protein n=1 Tax=Grosmannia clavigera (strain kw1407 / UAMH 11150) TaxID=655863 RepID=F0XTB0_GROCL|nr:uncharacterized protein CMQ_5757 [Grosmannia clavigera kw1407]EFW99336.1 hypothetical protein CMQ_5757 [Grosmannia clavigera kw1407]